jgi:hypothetical protein
LWDIGPTENLLCPQFELVLLMKRFMFNFPAIQLRQTITTVLLGIFFLVGIVFCSNVPDASAKSLTPEAQSYQVDRNADAQSGYFNLRSTESPRADDKVQQAGSARPEGKAAIAEQRNKNNAQQQRNEGLARNAKENLNDSTRRAADNTRSAADNVREKLNLDQPLYTGTKEFANDVKERVGTAVENTKDALGGIGDDVRDTVDDSFERVH